MTFEFNKNLPLLNDEYIAPTSEADSSETLPSIFDSENPDTPFVPEILESSIWDNITTWEPNSQSSSYDASTLPASTENIWNKSIEEQVAEYESAYSFNGGSWFAEIENRRVSSSGSRYKKYNSYTGSDIVPVITLPNGGSHIIGEISTISISVHSETFPVRMLGRRSPQGFTRGSRVIAGSIIFNSFDLYPFYDIIGSMNFSSGDGPWTGQSKNNVFPLADSLPPFDITITFMNEYGNYPYSASKMAAASSAPQGSVMRLYGVVLVDDGTTLSIDDLVPEHVFSYMASGIAPMHYPSGWKTTE